METTAYDALVKADHLRQAIRARPFRPFRIHLADGREVPVGHPENATVTSDDRCVFVYVPGEAFELLDVPLVTGIEFRRKRRRA
jgi:hypothetical protein